MSTQMSVFLSQEPAAPHWGDKALLSFAENGATIHLGEGHDLGAIQRAARVSSMVKEFVQFYLLVITGIWRAFGHSTKVTATRKNTAH